MTFQYFFFSTYIGYFLQVIPISFLIALIYGVHKFKYDKTAPVAQKICATLFICYIVGLLALTAVPIHLWTNIWHYIFYRSSSGAHIQLFTFEYHLIPDFFFHFRAENLGNILLFLPFGILYPTSRKNTNWKKTVFVGILITIIIEFWQPIVGRCFDINDIILNSVGVFISASAVYIFKYLFTKKH